MKTAACVAVLAAYFFYFAGPGLHSFFTHDDLANLSRVQAESVATVAAWNVEYFTPQYRPLGALFYRAFYEWFTLNPMPSRILMFAVLIAEFVLIYAISFALTKSREVGALAVLILCYHVNLEPLDYNTGMCYDVFCFLFYWAAFLYYVRIREKQETLRWGQVAIAGALYMAALNAKEMAVTLPAILIVWELLFHRAPPAKLARQAVPAIVLGLLTIPYLAGKLSAASIFHGLEPYKPVFTAANYWREASNLLGEALYKQGSILPAHAMIACALLAAIAIVSRSRVLAFCWFVIAIGILPIAFIPTRGIAQAWVPALGLGLAIAMALVSVRCKFLGQTFWSQAAMFVLVGVLLAKTHIAHGARHFYSDEEIPIRRVVEQLNRDHPRLPKGGKVLVLADPFPDPFTLASTILIRLYDHDPNLQVTRVNPGDPPPDRAGYDWVVSFQ